MWQGAPGVPVSGCRIGDCYYTDADHRTKKRLERMWKKMEKMGLRKERLQPEWISAAEGARFPEVMEQIEHLGKTLPRRRCGDPKNSCCKT